MKRTEIIKLQDSISAAYPNRKRPTAAELDYWYEQLKNYPLQACLEQLDYHIKWEKYPPTLVDFVKAGPENNEDLKKLFVNNRGQNE